MSNGNWSHIENEFIEDWAALQDALDLLDPTQETDVRLYRQIEDIFLRATDRERIPHGVAVGLLGKTT